MAYVCNSPTQLTHVAWACAVGYEQNAEGQREFCRHQLKNDKTRRLLEASMGAEWTERYMTEILFDSPKVEYGVCSTRVASNVDHTKR
jgi:hypothetical protein